ncbi:hypothetical protein ABK040_009470 [Willaertia magna]
MSRSKKYVNIDPTGYGSGDERYTSKKRKPERKQMRRKLKDNCKQLTKAVQLQTVDNNNNNNTRIDNNITSSDNYNNTDLYNNYQIYNGVYNKLYNLQKDHWAEKLLDEIPVKHKRIISCNYCDKMMNKIVKRLHIVIEEEAVEERERENLPIDNQYNPIIPHFTYGIYLEKEFTWKKYQKTQSPSCFKCYRKTMHK